MLHQDFKEEKEGLDDVNTSSIVIEDKTNSYIEKLREKTLNQVKVKEVNSKV